MPDTDDLLSLKQVSALAFKLQLETSTVLNLLNSGWTYSESIDSIPRFESPISRLVIEDVEKRVDAFVEQARAKEVQAASHASDDDRFGRTESGVLRALRTDHNG